MKVIVLAGGYSTERNVSFSSGALIANALIENGHEVMLLDLYLGIKNTDFPAEYTKSTKYTYEILEAEPDLEALKTTSGCNELLGEGVLDLCKEADVVFLALHGSIGENGQLQALFDLYKINYTGSGYIGCLLAMEKDISKKLMVQNGIATPDWVTVFKRNTGKPISVSFPCVVKPCSNGSSIGVSFADNETELKEAINSALKYEDKIIIEKKITGREFSVGILDGKPLPIIEIVPKTGFYDYKNKYQQGYTEEICPAPLDKNLTEIIQNEALKAHKTLNLGFYSRVDFLLDENGNFYCLEANALPGMTPTSLLPQEASCAGIDYNSLCEMICRSAELS